MTKWRKRDVPRAILMVVFMPNSAHEEFGKAPFCTWPGLGCAPRAQGNSWTWCFEHEPSHALVLPGFLLWDQTPYKWLSQPIIKIRVATSWFKEVQLNGGCNLLLSEPLRNEWHAEEKENSQIYLFIAFTSSVAGCKDALHDYKSKKGAPWDVFESFQK